MPKLIGILLFQKKDIWKKAIIVPINRTDSKMEKNTFFSISAGTNRNKQPTKYKLFLVTEISKKLPIIVTVKPSMARENAMCCKLISYFRDIAKKTLQVKLKRILNLFYGFVNKC